MKNLTKCLNDWTLFEKSWLVVFTLVEFYLFYAWNDTIMGLAAMLTGIWCVVLTAKAKRSSFIPGLVNVVLYAYISYGSKLYGEVMLNALYFLPMQFYGWYMWSKYMVDKSTVAVKMLSNKLRLGLVALSAVEIYLYGLFLGGIGGNFPFVDATSTVLSVIAMLLLAKRYGEQWFLWIFVNVASIVMWVGTYMATGEGVSMIVMWTAYLVNAVYGAYNWSKLVNSQRLI